jgi:hypothetical protein
LHREVFKEVVESVDVGVQGAQGHRQALVVGLWGRLVQEIHKLVAVEVEHGGLRPRHDLEPIEVGCLCRRKFMAPAAD